MIEGAGKHARVAIVVVAGLLGLFGSGLLSSTDIVGANGAIDVHYQRILRRTVQTDVRIAFRQTTANSLSVEMPSSFVRAMDIVSTSPRSTAMHATQDGVAYVFDTGGADSRAITLSMKPKSFGLLDSHFRVGGADVALRQLVWP